MLRFTAQVSLLVSVFTMALLGCGDDGVVGGAAAGGAAPGGSNAGGERAGGANEGGAGDGGANEGGSLTSDFVAGGDRPVTVHLPDGYDPAQPTPLVVLLHGYSASGAIQNAYFELEQVASDKGLIFLAPDGTEDGSGNKFWSATEACCNFGQRPVDDVAYLLGLIDEISEKVNVDPARVFFMGHSNGGFMSHRMACDHADRIAAIVSLAGATHDVAADCAAVEPVSVLQIHGTADATIDYQGGALVGNPYPGAAQTVATWATIAGCDARPVVGAPRDLEKALAGDETTTMSYAGCNGTTAVELWTIDGGSHVPSLSDDFSAQAVDWLLAHRQ